MNAIDPIKGKITDLIDSALATFEGVELKAQDIIEVPSDNSKGDYAFPCFRLAKVFRKAPPQIAAQLNEKLDINDLAEVSKVEVVGGYINFFIDANNLAKSLFNDIQSGNYFKASSSTDNDQTKVMIEYSQPNTHKEFHVGHGRNVCLGDAITRLYKFMGFNTMPVNYIGDEGTHIAKCLYSVMNSDEKIPDNKRAQWLGSKYVESNLKLSNANDEQKAEIQKELSKILADIESKQGPTFELWKETKQYCMDDFNAIYKWLDVHFDHFYYESDVSEESQKIVDEYLEKGLFKVDQGAVGIDLSDAKLGFMMVRKSDGNSLYITKDIALAHDKFNQFNIDRNVYVVGNEQDHHFKQLFHFLKLAGFKQAEQCSHLSYGMVVRPDGKMSSRSGNSFTFFQLVEVIKEELTKHMDKYKDQWSEQEIDDTIQKLAVGAIKFGMLSTDPAKEIVFDPAAWVRFDGTSGPYLMYSYARSKSIIEKAKLQELSPSLDKLELLGHETEKELIVKMYRFNTMAFQAGSTHKPSMVCTYLFELCKSFNQFYVQVPVLKSENKDEIQARLALIEQFGIILERGLNLIGITPAQKM